MVTTRKKQVVKFKNGTRYSEIFQTMAIKFSFVTENKGAYTELFSPVQCRDFLGDCIYSKVSKNQAGPIYGFSFNFEKTPYDADKTKLSLTFPTDISMENFKNNLHSLNELESTYKINKTVLYETDHKNTLIVVASPIWQSALWKLSLFTFYLKILGYKDRTALQEPEDRYLKVLTKENEEKLMRKIKNKTEEFNKNLTMIHNYSGFYTILKGQQNKAMTTHLMGKNYAL